MKVRTRDRIIALGIDGVRPSVIARSVPGVSANYVAMILSKACSEGAPIPRFRAPPTVRAPIHGPHQRRVPLSEPAPQPIKKQMSEIEQKLVVAEYESRLRSLIKGGSTVTRIAVILRKPYRELIADMERLGLARWKQEASS